MVECMLLDELFYDQELTVLACTPPTPVGVHVENVYTYFQPPNWAKKMLLKYYTQNVF